MRHSHGFDQYLLTMAVATQTREIRAMLRERSLRRFGRRARHSEAEGPWQGKPSASEDQIVGLLSAKKAHPLPRKA